MSNPYHSKYFNSRNVKDIAGKIEKKKKHFKYVFLIFLITSLAVVFPDSTSAETLLFKIPSGPTLTDVKGVTVDSSGNIYAVTFGNVIKFSSDGTVLLEIGSSGSGDGQLDRPHGVALDNSGNIYVADTHNRRIEKFDSAGTFQGWLGKCTSGADCDVGNSRSNGFDCTAATCSGLSSGSGDGQFSFTFDIEFDNSGNIYVADSFNHRIQKFNSAGMFQFMFGFDVDTTGGTGFETCTSGCQAGISGSGDGQFRIPEGIAVDSSGNIYVADRNHRVQIFDSAGAFQFMFGFDVDTTGGTGFEICTSGCQAGITGTGNGQFKSPNDITLDNAMPPNIYVADSGNHRVQIFDSAGFFQSKIGHVVDGFFGFDDGEFAFPQGIAVDGSGNIYVADTSNDRVQIFDSARVFQSKFGSSGSDDGLFNAPFDIAVVGSGNIYVADSFNNRVQIFDSAGVFQSKFGSSGITLGKFTSPRGITLDNSGNIYVADTTNDRVQIFDSAGNFIKMFGWGVATGADAFETCTSFCQAGIFGSGDGQFAFPRGIVVDGSDNIYVADTSNNRIVKFDSAGNFVGWMGKCTGGTGCDVANQRSFEFNCTNLCTGLGFGSGDGQFSGPKGITFDGSGNIYVADTSNHRIQKFDSGGTFQGWMGLCTSGTGCDDENQKSFGFDCTNLCTGQGSGSGDGQFDRPTGVAVDGSGNIYVAETDNHRVQIFDSVGVFQSKFGSKGSGDGQFRFPRGIALDGSGNIYVADEENHRIQIFVISCSVPEVGDMVLDMIVTTDCTLESSVSVPANVIVRNGAVMIIPNDVTLNIDFANFSLIIESGSGVLIQAGGSIT